MGFSFSSKHGVIQDLEKIIKVTSLNSLLRTPREQPYIGVRIVYRVVCFREVGFIWISVFQSPSELSV